MTDTPILRRSPQSVARFHEHLPEGGATLRVYAGVGHSLQDPVTGQLHSRVVADTCDWLLDVKF